MPLMTRAATPTESQIQAAAAFHFIRLLASASPRRLGWTGTPAWWKTGEKPTTVTLPLPENFWRGPGLPWNEAPVRITILPTACSTNYLWPTTTSVLPGWYDQHWLVLPRPVVARTMRACPPEGPALVVYALPTRLGWATAVGFGDFTDWQRCTGWSAKSTVVHFGWQPFDRRHRHATASAPAIFHEAGAAQLMRSLWPARDPRPGSTLLASWCLAARAADGFRLRSGGGQSSPGWSHQGENWCGACRQSTAAVSCFTAAEKLPTVSPLAGAKIAAVPLEVSSRPDADGAPGPRTSLERRVNCTGALWRLDV